MDQIYDKCKRLSIDPTSYRFDLMIISVIIAYFSPTWREVESIGLVCLHILSLSPLSEARACSELFRPRYQLQVVWSFFLYVELKRGVGFSLVAFGQVGVLCVPSSVVEYFFFSGVFYFIPFILLLCRRNLSRADAIWICWGGVSLSPPNSVLTVILYRPSCLRDPKRLLLSHAYFLQVIR